MEISRIVAQTAKGKLERTLQSEHIPGKVELTRVSGSFRIAVKLPDEGQCERLPLEIDGIAVDIEITQVLPKQSGIVS
jgi:hypothetical protein